MFVYINISKTIEPKQWLNSFNPHLKRTFPIGLIIQKAHFFQYKIL